MRAKWCRVPIFRWPPGATLSMLGYTLLGCTIWPIVVSVAFVLHPLPTYVYTCPYAKRVALICSTMDSTVTTRTATRSPFWWTNGSTLPSHSMRPRERRPCIAMVFYCVVMSSTHRSYGYIDEVSVSGRVRAACEILEQATLGAPFNFDGSSPLLDQGPNKVQSSGSNYAIVTSCSRNRISFTSSPSSYLQAAEFLAFAIPNQPFSISQWNKPASYLGFASNRSSIAQVLTTAGCVALSYASLPPTTFSHVALTWSSTNGLRLFVDNGLIDSQSASTRMDNSVWLNYVTLASCLNGCGSCNTGQVSPGQFVGVFDDFQV